MREFFLSPIGDLPIDVAADAVEDEVEITDSYSGLYNVMKAVARKNELPSLHSQQVLIEINNQRGALEVDRKAMYMFIKKTLLDPGFMREHLGADLKSCFDKTAPYAKTLEDKGKFMVLSMGSNDRVGAFNDHINEYTFADIDGKFCILDGLTYNSDSYSALYYLEV